VPFVGRETELRTIVDFLNSERVVVIHGEPGAGKSRLALEVCHSLQQHSAVWLGCHQESLRYSLLESLVRQHFKQFPEALQHLNVSEQAALANLVPDLIEVGISSNLEPLVLFNAVKSLLPNSSTVLVIDDAQWIDTASLEFLVFLLERTTQSALKLILTKRNHQTSRNQVETLLNPYNAKHITLNALSESAITTLALSLQAKQIDVAALLKRSGGNAFFVLELLQFAVTGETKAQEMVGLRLQSLSEPAQQVLEALSLRKQATFAHLRSISGRSLEELNLALEELQHAALVSLENNQIAFVHDIVREVIENELSNSRRNLLNYRAAQIKDQHTARHYWEAKSLWDEKDEHEAQQAFLEFGRTHAGRGDLTQALQWLGRSLETAKHPEARAEVFLETANTLESFGRHQQALEELETAASIAESLAPVLKARLFNTRALILQREYRNFDESKIALDSALEILEDQNTPKAQNAISETYNLLGFFAEHKKQYQAALEYHKKAGRIRRATGNQSGLADSIGGMGLVYMALNDSKAESHLLECLSLRETLGDVQGTARVLTNLGIYYGRRNQFEKALGFQTKSLELQQQLENPTSVAIALNNLGVIYYELGQHQNALMHYQKAIDTLEINNLPARQDFHDNLEEVTAKLVLPR
jgi:tetratricopeptide (TPR) repeat protein